MTMEDTDLLTWRKARASGNGGNCVEVGSRRGRAAGIRDSKRPDDGHLVITPTMLGALLTSVKRGDLDMPRLASDDVVTARSVDPLTGY
jgi:hypothetical protein